MPTIRIKNIPPKKQEAEFQKALLSELRGINKQVVKALAKEGLVNDSITSVLSNAFNAENINKLLKKISSSVFKDLWKVVASKKIPIINPSTATNTIIDKWVNASELRAGAMLSDYQRRIYSAVAESYRVGGSRTALQQQLNEVYGISQRQAKFIARDETANLTSAIAQDRDKAIGVEFFIWRTVQDQRVRDSHRHVNGEKCPLEGIEIDGEMLRPGDDYNCRCYSESIVEF